MSDLVKSDLPLATAAADPLRIICAGCSRDNIYGGPPEYFHQALEHFGWRRVGGRMLCRECVRAARRAFLEQ